MTLIAHYEYDVSRVMDYLLKEGRMRVCCGSFSLVIDLGVSCALLQRECVKSKKISASICGRNVIGEEIVWG